MGTIAEKITYLGETKTEIKDAINLMGTNITNDTFRSYPDKIRDGLLDIMNNGIETTWNNWEKVTGTGTDVTLNNVVQAPMKIDAQGNTIQEGTPSPTNPIPIQSVGDNVNLFDKNTSNILNAYLSSSNIISGSGQKTIYIPITGGKTYTISKILSTRFKAGTTTDTPSAGSTCIDYKSNDNGTTITITTSSTANYLCAFVYNPSSDTLTAQQILDSIKIEENSQATPYSPYNMGAISIEKCNKNRLDSSKVVVGIITTNGNYDRSVTAWNTTDYISIEPNEAFTFSWTPKTTGNYWQDRIIYYDKNKQYISGEDYASYPSGYYVTKTAPANARFCRLSFTNTGNYERENLQFEKGSTATTYTPHLSTTYPIYTQAPMRAKGEVRDDFIKQAGVWYERHKIGRVVYTGAETEDWVMTSSSGFKRFNILLTNGFYQAQRTEFLSNYFKYAQLGDAEGIGFVYGISNGANVYLYPESSITTVEAFKTWLSTHNTEVIYQLAEPTLTPCTAEQVEQLEAISQAKSYNGQTNIYSNDVVVPYLSCIALKNI